MGIGNLKSGNHWAILLFCTSVYLLLPGCGPDRPKTIVITGTVTYKGKPIEGANVMFMCNSGRPAYGFTDAAGRFSLGTFGQADGAVEGEHTVVISKGVFSGGIFGKPAGQEEGSEIRGPRDPRARVPCQVIPARYTSPSQSPLKVPVSAGGNNDFQFDLTD